MKVAILGVGLMGSQIGCEYALGGHDVTLVARDPERAAERIENAIELAAEFHIAPQHELAAAASRLHVISSVEEGDSQTDLVVESVVEDFALKVELLEHAARAFPTATIASNTSSLSITQLGEAAGAPERTLGTHYWNPPLLLPLVEVTAGEHTEPERIERMVATLTKLGKRPVRVEKDVPGFVWNRLQLGTAAGGTLDCPERRSLTSGRGRDGPLRPCPTMATNGTFRDRCARRRAHVLRRRGEPLPPPLDGNCRGRPRCVGHHRPSRACGNARAP